MEEENSMEDMHRKIRQWTQDRDKWKVDKGLSYPVVHVNYFLRHLLIVL